MFLSYGTYKHPPGECAVSIDRATIENAAHVPIEIHEVWTINGMLTSLIGPYDIDQQISALKAAYSQNDQDLILYLPDGVTPSSTAMISANSLGGVRVTQQPSFPRGENAERVTFYHYTIRVEAGFPIGLQNILVDYHESLKFRGGLPLVGYLEPAVGLAEPQTWKQTTTYKASQEGSATGYLFTPQVGLDVGIPIWPANIVGVPEFDQEAAEREGSAYKNIKVTWHYDFESITPLVGSPTPWPLSL